MLAVAHHSGHYFTWSVNSISCQQHSVQCTASLNVTDDTMCSIRRTTGDGTPTIFSIPLNTRHRLPYSSPGIVYYFEFSVIVNNHFLIMDNIRAGWSHIVLCIQLCMYLI